MNDVDVLDGEEPRRWSHSRRFVPRTFVQPVLAFLRGESAGGVVVLVAAVLAVIVANSPAADLYAEVFEARVSIDLGSLDLGRLGDMTVREWINDGAMVLFFFIVGLEIKREVLVGELNDARAAALPAIAALGGMLVPALIFLAINTTAPDGSPDAWAVPMATDIAFAVALVAALGKRVPLGAKLFLLALAIVDDLGAILVIAIVYTEEVSLWWLLAAAAGLLTIWAMNRVDVRSQWMFTAAGVSVWVAMLQSGVHATLAGVLVAMLVPIRSFHDPREFATSARPIVDRVHEYLPDGDLHRADHRTLERVNALIGELRRLSQETLPPLTRLEFRLATLSSLVIVPLFALANAGVRLSPDGTANAISNPVFLGVFAGLVLGKPIGVMLFSWLAVRTGLGRLPARTTWRHMLGLSLFAGIGFTVALFVSSLALVGVSLDAAKLAILTGSVVAGTAGYLFLRRSPEDHGPTIPHPVVDLPQPATTG